MYASSHVFGEGLVVSCFCHVKSYVGVRRCHDLIRVVTSLEHNRRVESYRHYRVAETHRMPGRAASGGALAPEPAARHRGRTRVPTDYSQPLCPLFFTLFEIGRLLFLRSHFNSMSAFKSDGRRPISFGETSDLRLDVSRVERCPISKKGGQQWRGRAHVGRLETSDLKKTRKNDESNRRM